MKSNQFWNFASCFALSLGIGLSRCPAATAPAAGEGFVYPSFTGDGEDGLHLLSSPDGKVWRAVKNYADVYKQSEGLMRAPSICRGGDGKYHLVWTSGWWDHRIGISHSANLVDWETNRFLYVWADYRGPALREGRLAVTSGSG